MRTLVIICQKGGTGKTTTAAALGQGLQARGQNVLYIDLDAQGNLTDTIAPEAAGMDLTSMDILERTASAPECVQKTPNGDIIAASPALAEADIKITAIGKEYRLRDALKAIQGQYDYTIIDTPPHLGIATINALTAATGVIIPTEAAPYSLKCITQLKDTIQAVKEYCNPELKVEGLLITRYNNRAIIGRDMADMLEEAAVSMGTHLYDSRIRECTALKEAATFREPIYTYAPKSNAAKDYTAFVEEFIERSKDK